MACPHIYIRKKRSKNIDKEIDFLAHIKYNYCADEKRGDKMSPRTGRPPSGNPKTDRLFIRVTPNDKKEIQEFSEKSGYGLLELLKIGIEVVKKK